MPNLKRYSYIVREQIRDVIFTSDSLGQLMRALREEGVPLGAADIERIKRGPEIKEA